MIRWYGEVQAEIKLNANTAKNDVGSNFNLL